MGAATGGLAAVAAGIALTGTAIYLIRARRLAHYDNLRRGGQPAGSREAGFPESDRLALPIAIRRPVRLVVGSRLDLPDSSRPGFRGQLDGTW